MLSDNVSLSLMGVMNVPGKQDIVPDVSNASRTRYLYVRSENSILYVISLISGATSIYADIVFDILPDID